MAFSARTSIGNADPLGRARGGVAVAVRSECGDASVREEPCRRRWQAGLGLRRVPRLEVGEAACVSGADEQDVAGLDVDALLLAPPPRGRRRRRARRGSSQRRPRTRGTSSSDPTTHEAGAQQVDRSDRRTPGRHRRRRRPAVEDAVVGDVAEGVDVAVPLVVVVDADVVLGEARAPDPMSTSATASSRVRRLGVVDARVRVERSAQRDRHAPLDEPRRCTRSGRP